MTFSNPEVQAPSRSFATFIISAFFVFWCIAFFKEVMFIGINEKLYSLLFDDAMISMRYAWNLANGNGLVWNPGEYVQGYSNLLMTLFMTLIHLIFDKRLAVMAVNVSGIVFMLLIAYATAQVTRHLYHDASPRESNIASLTAFALILCYYPLTYWSLMGMETGMLAMLLTFATLCIFKHEHGGKTRHLYLATLLLSLALLTRTESVIFASLLGLYCILSPRQQEHGHHMPHLLTAASLYIATGIGLLLFQHGYYGEWLPNTYTLKLTGMPLHYRIIDGIRFITPFLISMLIVFACVAADMIRGHNRKKVLACSIVVAAIAYNIYIGGDIWPYYRITAPVMPLLIALFVISMMRTMGLAKLHQAISNRDTPLVNINKMRLRRTVTAMVMFLGMLAANHQFLWELSLTQRAFLAWYHQHHTNAAIMLDSILKDEATVGITAAGIIPYYTDKVAVDFLGKMDKHVARLPPDMTGLATLHDTHSTPGHNKYDLEYSIKQLQPTYISLFRWGGQDLTEWVMQNYVQVKAYGNIDLYLLKESPHVNWQKLEWPIMTEVWIDPWQAPTDYFNGRGQLAGEYILVEPRK